MADDTKRGLFASVSPRAWLVIIVLAAGFGIYAWVTQDAPPADVKVDTAVKACQKAVESRSPSIERWVFEMTHGEPPERVNGQARFASGSFTEYECTIEWRDNEREAVATLTFMS